MGQNSGKAAYFQYAVMSFISIFMLSICGCGDFFAEKPIELETQATLNELKQIRENPATLNPLPDFYLSEPRTIEVKSGVKLFYFAKNQTVEGLSKLIANQFFGAANAKEVNVNAATNQLIVHCPDREVVDKILEFLEIVDVQPIQINIDCIIVERFADVTMDWETTIQIENLLGESITLGGKPDGFGGTLPAFPGASLREAKRADFGLNVGDFNNGKGGHIVNVMVDMLVSRGYLKILMNPKLETVNGKTAKIVSRDNVPIQKIVTGKINIEPYSLTEYVWVEDSLEVTPYVYADGSIGLKTSIKLGSRSKPEGVVQASVITERSIDIEENRIAPGDSLIIGGLRKNEERAVIRGVPFFKDIPLIGVLFSSKDFEDKANEVIFILTPSISSGGIDHTRMMEDVRGKLKSPEYEYGLKEVFTDPFGRGAYTEHVEQKAAQAEFERFKAEIEKTEAVGKAHQVKVKLLDAAEEILAQKAEIAKARAEVKKAKAEAIRARLEAEKAKRDAEKKAAEAEKITKAAEAKKDKSKVQEPKK